LNRKEEAVKRNSVIIGIVILLFVAGGSLKALASGGAPKVLKVKGLYLGMNIDKGARIIKEFITPKIAEKLGEGEPLEVARIPPYAFAYPDFLYFMQTGGSHIDQVLLQMYMKHRMRTYQAFFHVNPDYAYWYGWAMMVKDLDEIKELAKTMRATTKMNKMGESTR
jgi:hypothetical protein